MKKIFLSLFALILSVVAFSQTSITLEATPNPGGSVTVSWDAQFTELGAMYLTVSVAWSRNINENTIWTGVYSWYAYNPSNGAIQTSGTRTIFPPPGLNVVWARAVGNACSRTGDESDDYECAPTFNTQPFKLIK